MLACHIVVPKVIWVYLLTKRKFWCKYYLVMASIVTKKQGKRQYLYWVRSARVNGKPRIVEQIYLGPKDRVMEEIRQGYSSSHRPGPCPLKKIKNKEFGASALLWHWARELQLAEIVDSHVPPVESRRRTKLSVGQYLLVATINRAIDARSKRALYQDWFQHSVLSRLVKAEESDLSSQRFWDHMDQVEPEHIEAIQRDLLQRVSELFPLGDQTVLYDTTNFFSFIDSFNDRPQLPQRGANKQHRNDLRQVSLALFEDEKTGLPLYHQCYEGNRPDVQQFGDAWGEMLKAWMAVLDQQPEQLTLVFDAGNTSKNNLRSLEDHSVHYVGAIPPGWMPDLLNVPLPEYSKLSLPNTKHLKAYRTKRGLWGRERTVLVSFSPTLYCAQRKTMNRQQHKIDQQLRELADAIDAWRETRKGKGHREADVRKKIRRWTAREHLRDYLDVELDLEDGKVARLTWKWDLGRKREIQRRWLGKRILITDQHQWSDLEIALAYRRLARTEQHFRISKARRGPWWPMYHWTDSKIRVHALYCHFVLLLLAIIQQQLRDAGLSISIDRALRSLAGIDESLVVYSNGTANRVLSELSPTQAEVAKAIDLPALASQLGTTLLQDLK